MSFLYYKNSKNYFSTHCVTTGFDMAYLFFWNEKETWISKKVFQSIVFSWVLVSAQVNAQTQPPLPLTLETNQAGPNARIEVLSERFKARTLAPQETKLVIYRHPKTAPTEGVVSLFINERYHASLMAGGFTEVCLPRGTVNIKLRATKAAERTNASITQARIEMDEQTGYISLMDSAGPPAMVQVSEAVALTDLSDLLRQVHTMSRVPDQQSCTEAASTPSSATPAPAQ
jgi:hypothetical protein